MSQAFILRTRTWSLIGVSLVAACVMMIVAPDVALAKKKPKKPKLTLTVLPRIAMAPVDVLLVARLEGGDELEELYCPEVEIEWGDGSSGVQEPECEPFEPGVTMIERRYSASHRFGRSGVYDVRFRLSNDDRTILDDRVQVHVGHALGEMD